MAFNGSGVFNRIYNWVNDKANGYKITASRMDGEFDGIATGLSNCITKDGQTTISANIPFSTYKITGLGSGTARTDAINVGQVQDNQFLYLGTTSGSADAYTLAPSPAITAYTATQQFTAKINATNLTTTPYLQLSAIANPTTTAVIKKLSATKTEIAVAIGDLVANGIYTFKRNSANDAWIVLELSNPATTTTQGVAYLSNPITISNNGLDLNNDIDFSAGVFQFSDGSGQAVATAIMTKRLDATWSAGTNQGGLLNGTAVPKANDSTYHCYAIYNPTNNVIDFAFLLGIAGTAPDPTSVLPSGYTKFAFRGSVITDGSGNIIPFNQFGRSFAIAPRVQFTNTSQTLNTETLRTLQVPKGVYVKASGNITLRATGTGSANAMIYDADTSITITTHLTNLWAAANTTEGSCSYQCWTNKSGQLKTNATINTGSPTCTLSIALVGWEFDNKTLNF